MSVHDINLADTLAYSTPSIDEVFENAKWNDRIRMNNNAQLAELFLNDSAKLIDQSMLKLQNCLSQLSDKQLWWRPHPDSNSIGNLILHMCGNLRQWAVCGVGDQDDSRDRENEFSKSHSIAAEKLLQHATEHANECLQFLKSLDGSKLNDEYTVQGFSVNGLQAINHTITHFVGHTHQIVYITRLQLGEKYKFGWSPDDRRDQLPI